MTIFIHKVLKSTGFIFINPLKVVAQHVNCVYTTTIIDCTGIHCIGIEAKDYHSFPLHFTNFFHSVKLNPLYFMITTEFTTFELRQRLLNPQILTTVHYL